MSCNRLPYSCCRLWGEKLENQIDHKPEEGEPEYGHEEPHNQPEKAEDHLQEEHRHDREHRESKQFPEHASFLVRSGQAAVRCDVSDSFIGSPCLPPMM